VNSSKKIEEFIMRFSLDEVSAQKLRQLPPEAKAEVMKPGLNNARNPSAVVWTRMKAAQANWARSKKAGEASPNAHASIVSDGAAIAPAFLPSSPMPTAAHWAASSVLQSLMPPQIPGGTDQIRAFQHAREFDAGTFTSQLRRPIMGPMTLSMAHSQQQLLLTAQGDTYPPQSF
jgi:hypothetical protein